MGCHRFCRELKLHPPRSAARCAHFDMRDIKLTDGFPRRVITSTTQGEVPGEGEESTAGDACGLSVVYRASAWEREWRDNIQERQSDDIFWARGCAAMRQALDKTEHWLKYYQSRRVGGLNPKLDARNEDVFSYHEYSDTCTKRVLAKVPLEPLVGTLRHPYAVCDADEFKCDSNMIICRVREFFVGSSKRKGPSPTLLSKEYMLPLLRAEFMAGHNLSHAPANKPRTFFFDLGASTYKDGGGGPSLSWFIETYRESGLQFQRVIGWEAKELKPAKIFEGMPNDLMTSISYFNIPVEDAKGGKNNPWRYVRDLVQPEDFVVVKVDIDTPKIEAELMRQLIMNDDKALDDDRVKLCELIDELYFEHHVWGSGLSPTWAGNGMDGDMVGSYTLFAQLRNLGIRAHSWV